MSQEIKMRDLFDTDSEEIVQEAPKSEKKSETGRENPGLRFDRFFTRSDVDPLDEVEYEKRNSQITEPSGKVVFELKNLEVPKDWSQLATDILASKYCRRAGVPKTGYETSAKQVVHRVANTIRQFGEEQHYFATKDEADTFESELKYILIHQHGAFNSPVWFNVGLYHQYNIKGNGGNFYWDPATNTIKEATDSFSHPQGSACFINSVNDDLMSIFELTKTEAKLFKFGSGTGTNFSTLRSKHEKLSGGGTSSGLLSFLEVLDKGAAATKSGGTTRRAAKMVILDVDHPEILDFINWKVREEEKAKALIKAGYDSDFNGDAYRTVSGQNSNNSVRVTDDFMKAVENNDDWATKFRTTGEVAEVHKANDIMNAISEAAWASADPGIQFHDTINRWHTCPNTSPINASNPCSEYMFIDNSACNLASVNLMKYLKSDGRFDVDGFRHTCRVLFTAQEILVDLSSYPTHQIAQNSHDFRPLGLGYANLGTLLMVQGIPYDSSEAHALAGAITAIMTGHAYRVSAEIASVKGAFNGFSVNRKPMLNVIGMHREAVENIDSEFCSDYLLNAARQDWDEALELGKQYGFRNAQATVLAPTGTIGLLMDCDTTGVEPDFTLVKWKKLAGGGVFKIINQSLPYALKSLGYSDNEVMDIINYVVGRKIENAPHINPQALKELGYSDKEIEEVLTDVELFQTINSDTRHISRSELRKRGLTDQQIDEAYEFVNGTGTIEGAPHLKPEHYPVFDTANKCGVKGTRFIKPMGHVRMMAAVQPFLSGAISKTVNLPNETTMEEIKEIYMNAWKMGLKAIAIYRDGSKGAQVYNQSSGDEQGDQSFEKKAEALIQEALKDVVRRGEKKPLPAKRKGINYSATIGGKKLYFRTGEYEDGTLGEVFIDMFKAGASYKSMLDCFAVAVSLGLQYGVPLEKFVDKFIFTRFEPSGFTDHPNVKNSTSVLDFMFRVLGFEYLGRTDLAHVTDVESDDTAYDVKEDIEQKEQQKRIEERKAAPVGGADSVQYKFEDDAPLCDSCGHTTVRNGSCYRCHNCGSSMGCS